MFYDDKAKLDKSTYKKPKREKHFECTKCGNECSHVTTSKKVLGIEVIPEDEAYCKRCTTFAKKKVLKFLERKLEQRKKDNGKEKRKS